MPNPNAWMGDVVWVVEKYEPAESVYVRWLLGVDRQQLTNYQVLKMVHREYFAGFGKTIFPFWAGKRLLRRAELNDRDEGCTRASYRDMFREKGYHASGRSAPVYQVVPQEDAWVKIPDMPTTHCCCLMFGGATTAEAVMEECEENPSNPNCASIIAEGIRNCDELVYDASPDVVAFVVNDANSWQTGSGFNAQQLLNVTDEYHRSWASEMARNRWTTRSFGKGELSHDNMMWRHLERTYREDLRFKKRGHFEKCSGLLYQLKLLKIRTDADTISVLDAFKKLLRSDVQHQHKNYNAEIMLMNVHAIEHSFRNLCSVPKDLRAVLVFAALHCCLPLKDGLLHPQFHWQSADAATQIAELAKYEVKFTPKTFAELAPGPKAKAKAAAKRKGKKDKADQAEAEPDPTPPPPVQDDITVGVFDAIGRIVAAPMSVLSRQKKLPTQPVLQRFLECIWALFTYALTGEVDWDGEKITEMDDVRLLVEKKLVGVCKAHLHTLGIHDHTEIPDANPSKPKTDDDEDQHIQSVSSKKSFISDQERVATLAFVRENNDAVAGKHPAYHRVSTSLGLSLRQPQTGEVDESTIVRAAATALCNEIKPEWYNELNFTDGLVLDSQEQTVHFLRLRCEYIMMLLEEFCCGQTRLTKSDCSQTIDCINAGGTQLKVSMALMESRRDLQTFCLNMISFAHTNPNATEAAWKDDFIDKFYEPESPLDEDDDDKSNHQGSELKILALGTSFIGRFSLEIQKKRES